MNINQQYISERNSYSGQIPRYIVIHNTDNYSTGADARLMQWHSIMGILMDIQLMCMWMINQHIRQCHIAEAHGM